MTPVRSGPAPNPPLPVLDLLVVGAGFAGLYMLLRARRMGLSVRVLERAADVGGVWYFNRYPGARCDVESLQYSYSFDEDLQQQWRWSERYAPQAEILAYAQHVAERFDLKRDIDFNRTVNAANFDDASGLWSVGTECGERHRARFCIMATGCLSATRMPDLTGLADYQGATHHTGEWPHEGVDFSGQRVGVIGTGSSGIQAIPEIARQAAHLTVFQRTPNFSIPARNQPMDDVYEQQWKRNYPALRQQAREATTSGTLYERSTRRGHETPPDERQAEFERRWQTGGVNFMHSFNDLMLDARSNQHAADFVRAQIAATVRDPQRAQTLSPRDHPLGAKRICVDTDYHATFNRDNVDLVDLRRTPISHLSAQGLHTNDSFYQLDSLVFATGYDAMTGALLRMNITGRGGQRLADAWAGGPRSYLGLMTAGFPNLFTITGPGSPSVLALMILAIEQHVDWICDCLARLHADGLSHIEADESAQEAWVAHVNEVASRTLFPKANSWYLGANIPGKPRVFMPYAGGVVPYRQKCDEVAAQGYAGFKRSRHASPAPAPSTRVSACHSGRSAAWR